MSLSANFPAIRPSLLLDFANTQTLDPRITFTRSTTATYYDGVTTAKAEENLFTYSQSFAISVWGANGATKTSTTETDPAGGSTALLLTKVSTNPYSIRQYTGFNPASTQYTMSVYLKGTAGETVQLYMDNGVNQSINSLVTLTADWARYTITGTFNSTASNLTGGVAFNTSTTATSVYIAFIQVEQRSTATAYTATTTQAITNYIPVLQTAAANVARFDHNPTTGESLGLLIEEQRTNGLLRSEEFDTTWAQSASTIEANVSVAPSGAVTADKMVLVSGQAHTAGQVRQDVAKSAVATPYTLSVYAKQGGLDGTTLYFQDQTTTSNRAQVTFNLANGTIETAAIVAGTFTSPSATITSVGNGWYRCTLTATTGTETLLRVRIYTYSTTSQTGDGYSGIYIWGAQLEAGAFPTSYIATTSASVTRNADAASMTGTNFSSWYNQGEGSFYSSVLARGYVLNQMLFSVTNGTLNNPVQTYFDSASQIQTNVWGNGTVYRAATVNTQIEYALGMGVDNLSVTTGGGNVTTDTSAGPAYSYTQFNIGNRNGSLIFNGTIKKIAYYPERLTNAQLQGLTS